MNTIKTSKRKKNERGNLFTTNIKFPNTRQGFTLIELLIVMAIIAVLVSISIFAMQGARESGRNTQRKSDLETIRQGLELFKSDCGVYPTSLPTATNSLTGSTTYGCPAPGNSNVYIKSMPTDPNSSQVYYYSQSGYAYDLCAALEGEGSAVCGTNCGGGTQCTYKVTNP